MRPCQLVFGQGLLVYIGATESRISNFEGSGCDGFGVFFQPNFERYVFVFWGEVAVAVGAVTQEVPAHGVAGQEEIRADGGVVFGADPAVAIAVKEDLMHDRRVVVGPCVPETAVEEDGVAAVDADRDAAVRILVFVVLEVAFQVAAWDDIEVATNLFRHVAEEVADLEANPRTRRDLGVAVDASAALVEAERGFHRFRGFGFLRGDAQMGVIEVDVPARDRPDGWEGLRVIEQINERLVAAEFTVLGPQKPLA